MTKAASCKQSNLSVMKQGSFCNPSCFMFCFNLARKMKPNSGCNQYHLKHTEICPSYFLLVCLYVCYVSFIHDLILGAHECT